ncbi:divergent AAA domain protein [archaeon]|nr:divergent AAA domain protein [archaeon]
MDKEDVQTLISSGESRNAPNKDVYQTICAFLNRIGGHILLGVNNQGKITGVNPEAVSKIKKDIATAVNNPQKISPPVYLAIDDVEIDGKVVIDIYVPESSQVHRCNGRIYNRNEDGDLDITNHTDTVTLLYMRKQSIFSENKVYPYLTMEELRRDLFEKVRKIIGIRNPEHPWLSLTNKELLRSVGFYMKDYSTGKEGFTLGAVLLFGRDDVIMSVLPYHGTDAILRRENLDRYDDREIVETNLIESFDRLMQFIAKHLADPFFLEGDIRISLREKIFREVISNILIHREYINPYPAKLIIEKTRVTTENANKAHGIGAINPDSFSPFPKNPKIAAFFREIGRADKLGSGVRNIFKYTPIYSKGAKPELIEGDIFRIIIPLVPYGEEGSVSDRKTTQKILELIKENPEITRKELAELINITEDGVKYHLTKLKKQKKIKRIGPDKGGHWEVVK